MNVSLIVSTFFAFEKLHDRGTMVDIIFFTDFERFKNTFFRMIMAVVKRGARH